MVQAFTPNRTDDPFDVSTLPRSGENFFDIHYRDLVAELLSVDAVTISQQISGRCVERKGFEHLLRRPFSGRMSRDVKVDNTPSVMGENDKDEQDFKPNRVHSEEVN